MKVSLSLRISYRIGFEYIYRMVWWNDEERFSEVGDSLVLTKIVYFSFLYEEEPILAGCEATGI